MHALCRVVSISTGECVSSYLGRFIVWQEHALPLIWHSVVHGITKIKAEETHDLFPFSLNPFLLEEGGHSLCIPTAFVSNFGVMLGFFSHVVWTCLGRGSNPCSASSC